MFRRPPPETFINYQLQASLGRQPSSGKIPIKRRKRTRIKKRKDSFMLRQQDLDNRRGTYRPDRLIALHQSSLNNATRDATEVQRGLTAIGTTIQSERDTKEKKAIEQAKGRLLTALASRLEGGEPLLGNYASHRQPDDLNSQQRAINYKQESDAETRAKIYEGLLGVAETELRKKEVGYREHRSPEDYNRQRKTPSVGVADIEEIPPTPREELDKEPELVSTSSKQSIEPLLQEEPIEEEEEGWGNLDIEFEQPRPEPEPQPEPKPEPEPQPEAKGKVADLKDEVETQGKEFDQGEANWKKAQGIFGQGTRQNKLGTAKNKYKLREGEDHFKVTDFDGHFGGGKFQGEQLVISDINSRTGSVLVQRSSITNTGQKPTKDDQANMKFEKLHQLIESGQVPIESIDHTYEHED